MVSPGWLRTLTAVDETDERIVEPEIDSQGVVTYPFVDDRLDDSDGSAETFLESMAERSILAEEFVSKVYVCPECRVDGMQYSTACSNCGSLHATATTVVVHESCGERVGPAERVTVGDDSPCPECDEPIETVDTVREQRYRCQDCTEWVDQPVHRLRCRECSTVCPPEQAREEPLYRYPLTDEGKRWIDTQLDARQSLVDAFEARGYETAVDTTVEPTDGSPIPVHLVAEDDLLDDRIVAGIHETPSSAAVDRLVGASRASDARPVVLSTDGALDESVVERTDEAGVTVLTTEAEALSRQYEVVDEPDEQPSMLERVAAIFDPQPPSGPP